MQPQLHTGGLATRPRFAPGLLCALALPFLLGAGCRKTPEDEARLAGLSPNDFPQITADVFQPMDGGIQLSLEEIMGRNTWNLWSGGNQHFWNDVAPDSYGLMDLLKMLDNRKYPRGARFQTLGLVNGPGFPGRDQTDQYGLWLGEQVEPEPAGGDQKIYGKPSGVLGLRLFPNPEFDQEARRKWDRARWMNDPSYFNNNRLARPYRVGVACGSCHISPHPANPPADPENPHWDNLASAIGNQYIREGKVFAPNVEKGGFFYEMLAAQPPGSRISSRIIYSPTTDAIRFPGLRPTPARAMGTNAMGGHVWDNFSSTTYKELPLPDEVDLYNPFDQAQPIKFQPKKKRTGPGWYRTPSLVSLWSSASFLHNNALGKFTGHPSVAGRLEAFHDAADKLLWPEKRLGPASIWRT